MEVAKMVMQGRVQQYEDSSYQLFRFYGDCTKTYGYVGNAVYEIERICRMTPRIRIIKFFM